MRSRGRSELGTAVSCPPPYHGPALTRVTSDVGDLWIPASDGVMLPYLESRGTWEREVGDQLLRLGHDGMTFLDVGASFGYFSRLVAMNFPSANIHAFEPHPEVVTVLALNVWQVQSNIQVWPLAVGEARDTVSISSASHNIGDTRVSTQATSNATMIAPMARLDDLVTEPVDLVKIDVQGFEASVIRGMVRIAAQNPRLQIVLEYGPAAVREQGMSPLATLDFYRSAGYRYRAVIDGVPRALSDQEILNYCDTAGPDGEATLVLDRARDDH